MANPMDPTIVAGDVDITGLGSSLVVIDNNSNRAIVDWNSFSIGAGETTRFNQLGAQAAILNRVTGANLTEIYGTLSSNGQVYLINENGIVVGADGVIDTSGFVASTLDTNDADFLGGGDMVFAQSRGDGTITVLGKIRSVSGGDIFLLSREIEIGPEAELNGGYVGLGAGEEILLRPVDSGHGRVSVRAGKGKITNKGEIGAVVAELAAAGGNEYALAINNEGVVRATGATTSGGRVMRTAGGAIANSGTVKARKEVVVRSTKAIGNSGTVTARDDEAQKGGTVIFEAPEVVLEAGSLLDVSGALGGGRAFVGGGYQGKAQDHAGNAVDIRNALTVTVAEGAVIDASAAQGAGGEIVIWSDDTTTFKGDIRANAGAGKGGDAEVSGKRNLLFAGTAALRGTKGFGTLLLDPGTVNIVSGGTNPPGDQANTYTDDQINALLTTANLTISTTAANGSNGATEDIVIGRGVRIVWGSQQDNNGDWYNSQLKLTAGHDIVAESNVLIQNFGNGIDNADLRNAGGIWLSADNDVRLGSASNSLNGGVAIGSEFGRTRVSAGSDVILQGGTGSQGFAQIGYLMDNIRGGDFANGDILVEAGANVEVRSGGSTTLNFTGNNYAQIGHGGLAWGAVADIEGNITVTAGLSAPGDVIVENGKDSSALDYAQIGHGSSLSGNGYMLQSNISGNITVRAKNNGNIKVGTAFTSSTNLSPDVQSAQIGHGAHMLYSDTTMQNGALVNGAIQGTIDVRSENGITTGTGKIQIGADMVTTDQGDDSYVISSRIGHGAQVVVVAEGGAAIDQVQVVHANIVSFDTELGEGNTYATNIVLTAGSLVVQANETAKNTAGLAGMPLENAVRSQLGSGGVTVALALEQTRGRGTDLYVSEGNVTGNITAGMIGAEGITVKSTMTSDDTAIANDGLFSRIGHGGFALMQSGDGAYGTRGGDIVFNQGNVLQAATVLNTVNPAAKVTVETSVTSGLEAVKDGRVLAAIGSGGEAILRSGTSNQVGLTPGNIDAGRGGDIAFNKGTVWDGLIPRGSDNDSGYSGQDSSISINTYDGFPGGMIQLTSAQTAGTGEIGGTATRSMIGHGAMIDITTGAGGDALRDGAGGGRGGDVLIQQQQQWRDLGGANEAAGDDMAQGLRGDIRLGAKKVGDLAFLIDSSVTAGTGAVTTAQASATVGHGDAIFVTSGDGGDAGQGDGSATNYEQQPNDTFPMNVVGLDGGRGGNVNIMLNRTSYEDYWTPIMFMEGDIVIDVTGTLKLTSGANNGLEAADRASVQSGIGHGTLAVVRSGDGGHGGASAVGGVGTGTLQGQVTGTVTESELAGEGFLRMADMPPSNRGGNGGDVQVLLGSVTDRSYREETGYYHSTDADARNGSDITIRLRDNTVDDALIVTSMVGGGLAEGVGADVASTIGHSTRVTAIGGAGGDGGSANTQFDNNPNSLWGWGAGQTDPNGNFDANNNPIPDGPDETAGQAGHLFVQPNTSGGRGGDVLVVSGLVKGDITIDAASRVTVETAAGHGSYGQVTAQIGHNANLTVVTQAGGDAGTMYEPSATWQQATNDGGIRQAEFDHLLLDRNRDDRFDLSNVSGIDEESQDNAVEDGIALTAADIAARRATTFDSLLSDPDYGTEIINAMLVSDATKGVILHDEEADPQFILGKDANGDLIYLANTDANNARWAEDPINLKRFGRLVATYDGYAYDPGNTDDFSNKSMPVFVDLNRDGAVDLVDFDRDGKFDIVDLDRDGKMDQIDGRANYVRTTAVNGITGLGVLDYAAVTAGVADSSAVASKAYQPGTATGGWSLANPVYGENLVSRYTGGYNPFLTNTVGDFSTANGGRGGNANAITGYLSGDITINTAVNANGDAASLVVKTNLTDDPTAGAGHDMHRALIGHAGNTMADASGGMQDYISGLGAAVVTGGTYAAADGGDAAHYAMTANGGRGGDATVLQGVARDNNTRLGVTTVENDFLIGNIYVNTADAFGFGAGQVEIAGLADSDYGNNTAVSQIGHFGLAVAMGGAGGNGASKGSESGPSNDSQTEIANGGAGGTATIRQNQIKGALFIEAGENKEDGSVSLKVTAENGASDSPAGPDNIILSRLGHGRIALAVGGAGGDGNDGQSAGNGGAGGDATVTQAAITDTLIDVDLVNPDKGHFGNGMLVKATDGEGAGDIVRAQVGFGDMAWATGGNGGAGTPEWEVLEQTNQTADGGAGGTAQVTQAGYNYDIRLNIGANVTGGPGLEVSASENSIKDGANDQTLATIGHGGYAVATGGAGGAAGLAGPVDGINSGTSAMLDSDYAYSSVMIDGAEYAIDLDNVATFGTSRRGGAGGAALLNLNTAGTGRIIDDRLGSDDYGRDYDYGRNDVNGADIVIVLNDLVTKDGADFDVAAGHDGVYVHAEGGAGANSGSPLLVNAAMIGHTTFGEGTGGAGGVGARGGDATYVITNGNGGDGGDAVIYADFVDGDIRISNISGNFEVTSANSATTDKAGNIVFEAKGGSPSDTVTNVVTARAGHLLQLASTGGAGGDASTEAGSPPGYTATVSAQGGAGGAGVISTDTVSGDITLEAENSVKLLADANNGAAATATYVALGHKQSAAATGGDGGMGGTVGDQNLYFIYEALREMHARGSVTGLSDAEVDLVRPVLDYFRGNGTGLEIFLDALLGDTVAEIEANVRDDDFVGGTDQTIASLSGNAHWGGDDAASTLKHILAASGHGGNVSVTQGGNRGLSGDIRVTALALDASDAERGFSQIAKGSASSGGAAITQMGHVAEVVSALAGNGGNLTGGNAGANGIGGDGGDVVVNQAALAGGISVDSHYKLTVQAADSGSGPYQVGTYIGHRQMVGHEIVDLRSGPAVAGGLGGQETSGIYDDGLNGNGGDVAITQIGWISNPDLNTDILLAAMYDTEDAVGIDISSQATAVGKPDVLTAIGHQQYIDSVKAGDAGRMAALHSAKGALGLLEGNGGDITISQDNLGADIDIIARDGIKITALGTASGANSANLVIGHQRTIGSSSNSDGEQSGTIVAGQGGDSLAEYPGDYDGDGDAGWINIYLGYLGDSGDEGERLVTITSLTEDVDILAEAALGTARVEIGNQQSVMAETLKAGENIPVPYLRTAGDGGRIVLSRSMVSGDILIQTLDADRENSKAPDEGKQVTIVSKTAIGTAQVQIGHEVEYTLTTARAGHGASIDPLATNLETFLGLIDPMQANQAGDGPDKSAPNQATFADARAAVVDMNQILAAMNDALRYAGRLPASDGELEAVTDAGAEHQDRGELSERYEAAQAALEAARAALRNGDLSVEERVSAVLAATAEFQAAFEDFKTVFEVAPNASNVVAVYADAGDIFVNYGQMSGDVTVLAGRYDGFNDDTPVIGNDDLVANDFTGTAEDDLDDNVVKVTSEAAIGSAMTELGHRTFIVNTTGNGGGTTVGGPEDGGVAGDGGSILVNNITSGDVTLRAEEVVLLSDVATSGSAELHFGHSERVENTAGKSDIASDMGSGGDINGWSVLSGDVTITANQIASSVDGQDRLLKANAAPAGTAYLQMGHQVSWENLSHSDPIEPTGLGDGVGAKGSNRGGEIWSEQRVSGDVNITLANRDLIVMADGIATSQIRLGHSGQAGGAADEGSTGDDALTLTGYSGGKDSDDGDTVILIQTVQGGVTIRGVEDLAFRTAALGSQLIQVGHFVDQEAQSGQNNAPAGTTPAYGERVTAQQYVSGNLTFTPSSSFEASLAATSGGSMQFGHNATQKAFSADDGAEPSDFDKTATSGYDVSRNAEAIYKGVNDSFDNPDVLARQFVDGRIVIETGEILLSNGADQLLQLGHLAKQSVAADGAGAAVSGADATNPFEGLATGYVTAVSVIGAEDARIILTALGATDQTDTTLEATNGTEGDITLTQTKGAGGVQVGHRSLATTSDGTPERVAEGFYNTLQGIGAVYTVTSEARSEAAPYGADITLTAKQDIEMLGLDDGVIEVGHYVEQSGTAYTAEGPSSPVAVNPDSDADMEDSSITQVVDANVSLLAGNNVVMTSKAGTTLVGHSSGAVNEWQVEGDRSVTPQLLSGDITVLSGLDATKDRPDGTVAGPKDETGLGDDMLLDASAGGTVRIGHNAPSIGVAPANGTQVVAGDIRVVSMGDLHVLKGAIGHANYDFESTAVSASNATVEGMANGKRDRVQGNTTIAAGQNSPKENSTRVANILKLDGAKINSGYGGIGNKDVGGKLRFFLPAQEGLTVLPGTVFNDSASNGDAVPARSSNPGTIFSAEGGRKHEHSFSLLSDTAPYQDAYIGPGNYAFYFETPQKPAAPSTEVGELPVYIFTPTTGRFTAFSVKSQVSGVMNLGGLGGTAIAGAGSTEAEDCARDEEGLCVLSENIGISNAFNIVEDSPVEDAAATEGNGGPTLGQITANIVTSVSRSVRALFGGNA